MSKHYLCINDMLNFETKGSTPKYVEKSTTIVLNQKCVRDGIVDYSYAQFMSDEQNISNEKYIKIGDVLLNSTGQGTAGRCAFVDFIPEGYNVTVDSHMLILRFESKQLARFFAYSLYKQEKFILELLTGSSGQGELDREIVYNISFPYNQSNIDIFNKMLISINSKIKLNNKINQELEKLAKTLYDYWFVQFDFPDENNRPYKSSGGKMVYNEVLKREIPLKWEVDTIENVIQKNFSSKKLQSSEYKDIGKYPIIDQSTDFICGYSDNENYVISYDYKPFIVFGDHSCTLKLINFDFIRGADGTQIIITDNENINQYYLYYNIDKIPFTPTYERHFKYLKDYKIIIPKNLEVMNKYNNTSTIIFTKIKNNIFENKKLINLRDFLLPMLINGQVAVKD